MIVIVYGPPASGKNYYVNNFISKDKITMDDDHNFDLKKYCFLPNKDYFLITQSLQFLDKSIIDKADLFVLCEFIATDSAEGYVVSKRVSDKYMSVPVND